MNKKLEWLADLEPNKLITNTLFMHKHKQRDFYKYQYICTTCEGRSFSELMKHSFFFFFGKIKEIFRIFEGVINEILNLNCYDIAIFKI